MTERKKKKKERNANIANQILPSNTGSGLLDANLELAPFLRTLFFNVLNALFAKLRGGITLLTFYSFTFSFVDKLFNFIANSIL